MDNNTDTATLEDRYWRLARREHTSGLSPKERAELVRLSRRIGGAYHR